MLEQLLPVLQNLWRKLFFSVMTRTGARVLDRSAILQTNAAVKATSNVRCDALKAKV